jgi:hypothetical protein
MPLNDPESELVALDDETLAKLQILYICNIEDYRVIRNLDTADTEMSELDYLLRQPSKPAAYCWI